MSEWKTIKFSNLLTKITKGTTPPKGIGFVESGGVNYIKSDAVNYDGRIDESKFVQIDIHTHNKFKRSQLEEDDILFTMAGIFLGKSGIVTKSMLPANTNQANAILRFNKKLAEPKYIGYFLRQKNTIEYVNNMSGQSAQPNLNFQEISSIEINLPPLPEQKAIASVLSSLDDKIDLLHRQNETLEKMAETLFRKWFVEDAKEDWEIGIVSDFAIHFKESIQPQKHKNTIFYHYSLPSFDNQQNPVEELGMNIQSNKYKVPFNCILFSKLNPNKDKRVWLILDDVNENSICSTEFQVVLPKQQEYLYFLYCWLTSKENYNEIASGVGGTSGSHQRIDPKTIIEFTCPQIPIDLINKFNINIEPVFSKINRNRTQIKSLTKMRDTLLPKLMSGEVRVKLD